MALVLGVPYVPPPPTPDPFAGLTQRWEAWDGSVWPLNGDRAAGVRMQAGVRGLTMPKLTHFVDEGVIDGGQWQGLRTPVREVYWPVWVWHDTSSQAWLDYDAAFRRSLDPLCTGRWVVTTPSGRERFLECRFVDDGDKAWDYSPGLMQWTPYGITLQAEQPYWSDTTPTAAWFAGAVSSNFFPGPSLTISETDRLSTASMRNDGDLDASLTWWVLGGGTAASLGVGDVTVDIGFTVASGRMLVIDTDPTVSTCVEIDAFDPATVRSQDAQDAWVAAHLPAGTDRTGELDAAGFATLPRRATTPLTVELTGFTAVRASFTQRWWGAW